MSKMYANLNALWLLSATALVATVLVGCKSRTPSPADIKAYKAVTPFLIRETSIRGVYWNIDVDSLVFTYTTSIAVEEDFWQRLAERIKGSQWHELEPGGRIRQFERTLPRGEAMFSSAEHLRIAYLDDKRTVVVAYVQADSSEEETSFSETNEARWADKWIWPMFDELLAEGSPNQRMQRA